MTKEFIPYKEAKQLRKLGFKDNCFAGYTKKEKDLYIGYIENQGGEQFNRHYHILAPTYSQTFKWFKLNYNLWNMIYPRDGWNYHIQRIDTTISCFGQSWDNREILTTQEETELECLKKLIEIVKENTTSTK